MKVLHILRSEPDALTRRLIAGMANGGEGREIALYRGRVDTRTLPSGSRVAVCRSRE